MGHYIAPNPVRRVPGTTPHAHAHTHAHTRARAHALGRLARKPETHGEGRRQLFGPRASRRGRRGAATPHRNLCTALAMIQALSYVYCRGSPAPWPSRASSGIAWAAPACDPLAFSACAMDKISLSPFVSVGASVSLGARSEAPSKWSAGESAAVGRRPQSARRVKGS